MTLERRYERLETRPAVEEYMRSAMAEYNPDRLAIADLQARHNGQMADHYRAMAVGLSDVIWEIILLLQIPPNRSADLAGKNVLFGMYDAETILSRIRELLPDEQTKEAPTEA